MGLQFLGQDLFLLLDFANQVLAVLDVLVVERIVKLPLVLSQLVGILLHAVDLLVQQAFEPPVESNPVLVVLHELLELSGLRDHVHQFLLLHGLLHLGALLLRFFVLFFLLEIIFDAFYRYLNPVLHSEDIVLNLPVVRLLVLALRVGLLQLCRCGVAHLGKLILLLLNLLQQSLGILDGLHGSIDLLPEERGFELAVLLLEVNEGRSVLFALVFVLLEPPELITEKLFLLFEMS